MVRHAVLFVDDHWHDKVARWCSGWLRTEVAATRDKLQGLLARARFDLAIGQFCKPDATARSVLQVIALKTYVMALAGPVTGSEVAHFLEMGADEVVPSNVTEVELTARIRAVFRRVEASRIPSMDGPSPRAATLPLPRAERKLFRYLLSQRGRIVSQQELIEQVFGGVHVDGTALVRVHVSHLRRWLGAHGTHLRTFRGVGYALDPGPFHDWSL